MRNHGIKVITGFLVCPQVYGTVMLFLYKPKVIGAVKFLDRNDSASTKILHLGCIQLQRNVHISLVKHNSCQEKRQCHLATCCQNSIAGQTNENICFLHLTCWPCTSYNPIPIASQLAIGVLSHCRITFREEPNLLYITVHSTTVDSGYMVVWFHWSHILLQEHTCPQQSRVLV